MFDCLCVRSRARVCVCISVRVRMYMYGKQLCPFSQKKRCIILDASMKDEHISVRTNVDLLVGWFVGWSVGWVVGWLVGWSVSHERLGL